MLVTSVVVDPVPLVHRSGDDSVLAFTLHPTGHSCDQRCSLPTSILRLVEGHLALRRQILQRLLHDAGET